MDLRLQFVVCLQTFVLGNPDFGWELSGRMVAAACDMPLGDISALIAENADDIGQAAIAYMRRQTPKPIGR